MRFKEKCMYLGLNEFKSKNGDIYHQVKLLSKETADSFVVFVSDPEKFKNYKLYSDYDFDFDLYKNSKNLWNLSLVVE